LKRTKTGQEKYSGKRGEGPKKIPLETIAVRRHIVTVRYSHIQERGRRDGTRRIKGVNRGKQKT